MISRLTFLGLFLFVGLLACSGPEDSQPKPEGEARSRPVEMQPEPESIRVPVPKPQLVALVSVPSKAMAQQGFDIELLRQLKKQVPHLTIEPLVAHANPVQVFLEGRGDLFGASLKIRQTSENMLVLTSRHVKGGGEIHCQSQPHAAPYRCSSHLDEQGEIEQGAPFFIIPIKASDDEDYAWLLRGEHGALHARIMPWLLSYKTILFVAKLNEQYHGHLGLFNTFDLYVLRKRYKRVLPKYKPLFETAAKRFELDPLFLAAMSYQESHWNPHAKSPTGVKGLMMLTKATAKSVGVKNRLDPKQSIFGGAKYYKRLHQRIPASVIKPDRDWFALAAYNVGMGHLYDARFLAREEGLNDNYWFNIKKTLPYLSEPRYYKRLQYGKARGYEPVQYVQNIRNFHWQLQKMEKEHNG